MKIINKIKDDFKHFILGKNHPCLMSQAIAKQDNFDIHQYDALGSERSTGSLLKDIGSFIKNYDFTSKEYHSFIAVFKSDKKYSEDEFESALWQQLQLLHESDPYPTWDPTTSANPEDNNFSFSLFGKAFYVVGLHPQSSRFARQFEYPALVFNLHHQFEKLRKMGRYDTVRDKIRDRDKALQGSINPMLEDFGSNSEARQYSGKAVDKKWKCPFAFLHK